MIRAVHELLYLWETRNTSGFPWPTWRGFGGGWHMVVFGYPRWAAISHRKQTITIPLRPWRYLKKVREIARARAIFYHPTMEDNVP